jgi:hypothetical protein
LLIIMRFGVNKSVPVMSYVLHENSERVHRGQ